MSRTLVVGDIQGCLVEFLDLVAFAELGPKDRIVAVGDLVDRGPDSPGVLEYFQTNSRARSVMGNHERKHIRWFYGLTSGAASLEIARRQFGEKRYKKAILFMQTFPAYLELEEAIVAHGFWEHGVTLNSQKKEVLTGVSSGERYILSLSSRPWWESYDGPKPLIVGHHDYSKRGEPLNYRDRVYGIDTGCCYGNRLTGLLLPEFELLSVPAKKNYWALMRQKHNLDAKDK